MASNMSLAAILLLMIVFASSAQDIPEASCPSCSCISQIDSLSQRIYEQEEKIICLESTLDQLESDATSTRNIWDCDDVDEGSSSDGVYQIRPEGTEQPFNVSCIFDEEGKWTVLQRRIDGRTNFNRVWAEHKRGFGENGMATELWLGLEKMHQLTLQRQYIMRIDLIDWDDQPHYAEYSYFRIGDEASNYRLDFSGYSGTLVDMLSREHNGKPFSTFDNDNDNHASQNCAEHYQSGWWHWACYHVNLNGPYRRPPSHNTNSALGIQWHQFRGNWYSLKGSVMRIRPTYSDPLR